MIGTDEALQAYLRHELRSDAESAIPDGVSVVDLIRRRINERGPQRRRRMLLLISAFAIGASLVAGSAIAVSNANRPIVIHRHSEATSGNGTSINATIAPDITTTVPGAETRLGFHVSQLTGYAGARLTKVVIHSPILAINGKPTGRTVSDSAVSLDYDLRGAHIQLAERLELPANAALEVDLKSGAPTDPKASTVAIEPIGGAQYLVARINGNHRIAAIEWKTLDGVVIAINSANGLDDETVASLINHLG